MANAGKNIVWMTGAVAVAVMLGFISQFVLASGIGQGECDSALEQEWLAYSGARESIIEREAQQPTAAEKADLRNIIEKCSSHLSHFQVRAGSAGSPPVLINVMLLAVLLDDREILDLLVAEGDSPDGLPSYGGVGTLSFAVWRQLPAAISWALVNGVDPNLPDDDGRTALMYAAERPQDTVASLVALLDHGAEVDAVSGDGWTALAVAIRKGQFDSATILVEAGANAEYAKSFLLQTADTTSSEAARMEIRELVAKFERDVQLAHN